MKEICKCKNINIPWPMNIDITTIMALPLLKIQTRDRHIHNGASCLFLIIMSECAFLIWKLRCKRLLDITPEEPTRNISPQEAYNQALCSINKQQTKPRQNPNEQEKIWQEGTP